MYESVFVALCDTGYRKHNLEVKNIDLSQLRFLKNDKEFIEATERETGRKINVEKRLSRTMEAIV